MNAFCVLFIVYGSCCIFSGIHHNYKTRGMVYGYIYSTHVGGVTPTAER